MLFLLTGFFFLPGKAVTQSIDWRSRIDNLVQIADSLSMRSQNTFHLNKFIDNDRPIRETWHYTLSKGKVVIFEVHYFLDSLEFQEVYYLDRDQIICMERYEILYPAHADDRILSGTVGFFENQSLRQYITMGKVEDYDLLPEYDAIARFRVRYRELAETRPLLEKDNKGSIFVP
ncbi:hypothetical protein [Flavihumibacter petaseus]|uniref:hypothetical protein n=1 Tax=Flavihumibacter petaseus TaxID=549295 RepID=UPI0012F78A97|nr:hypothetical protein [Flavihumibacter petaseus]